MRARKFSHVALLAGLVLAMGGLWLGATPLIGRELGVVGGWVQWLAPEGVYVAANLDQGTCVYCFYTYSASCSEFQRYPYEPCNGGSISVAKCAASSSAGKTTHAAAGPTPCWSWEDPWCEEAYDAACY